MCAQRRHRSVCAYTQFDHSLHCLFEEVLSLFFTVMVLAPVPPGFSRRKTAGISEAYAFSNPRCLPGLSRIMQYDPVLSRLVPGLGLCTYGVSRLMPTNPNANRLVTGGMPMIAGIVPSHHGCAPVKRR